MKRIQKSRRPAKGQAPLPYEGWEAIRETTRRRRDELVAGVRLSPTLRRMLLALHTRCCGKRFCWPSLRTLAADLGYQWPTDTRPAPQPGEKRTPLRNPAKRTMLRQLRALEELGILHVEHHYRPDGGQSSSVYAIRYGALRTGGFPSRTEGKLTPHHPIKPGPKMTPPPASPVTPPGVIDDAPRRHQRRPPASPVTPHEWNRKEWNRNETAASAVVCAPPELKRANQDGGGGLKEIVSQTKVLPSRKVSGAWCGAIDAKRLANPQHQFEIFQAAIAAGLIQDTPISRVRLVAACLQAKTKNSPAGWLVTRFERGEWIFLSREGVRDAIEKLKLKLTPEQFEQVRSIDPP